MSKIDHRFEDVELDNWPVSVRECQALELKHGVRKIAPYEPPKHIDVDSAAKAEASVVFERAAEEGLERFGILKGKWKGAELCVTGVQDMSERAAQRTLVSNTYHDQFRRELIMNSREARYGGGNVVGHIHVHFGDDQMSFNDKEFFERSPASVFAIVRGAKYGFKKDNNLVFSIRFYHCDPTIGKQASVTNVQYQKKIGDAGLDRLGYWQDFTEACNHTYDTTIKGGAETYRKLVLSDDPKDRKKADQLRKKYENMIDYFD